MSWTASWLLLIAVFMLGFAVASLLHQKPMIKLAPPDKKPKRGRHKNLTDDEVQTIRKAVADGALQADVAARFGLHITTVSHIITGRRTMKSERMKKPEAAP